MNARFLTLILITAFVAACGRVDRELAGTWRITRSISQGKETQAAADRASRRNFDDGVAVTLHPTLIAGKPYEVTGRARYSVDRSTNPKTIVIEYFDGPAKGMIYHGIYEISGDVMKICVGLNGGPTPTRFESPVGSDTNVDYYERVR